MIGLSISIQIPSKEGLHGLPILQFKSLHHLLHRLLEVQIWLLRLYGQRHALLERNNLVLSDRRHLRHRHYGACLLQLKKQPLPPPRQPPHHGLDLVVLRWRQRRHVVVVVVCGVDGFENDVVRGAEREGPGLGAGRPPWPWGFLDEKIGKLILHFLLLWREGKWRGEGEIMEDYYYYYWKWKWKWVWNCLFGINGGSQKRETSPHRPVREEEHLCGAFFFFFPFILQLSFIILFNFTIIQFQYVGVFVFVLCIEWKIAEFFFIKKNSGVIWLMG